MYYSDSPFTTVADNISNADEICQKLKARFNKHFFVQTTQLSFAKQDHILVKGKFTRAEADKFKAFAENEALQPA